MVVRYSRVLNPPHLILVVRAPGVAWRDEVQDQWLSLA